MQSNRPSVRFNIDEITILAAEGILNALLDASPACRRNIPSESEWIISTYKLYIKWRNFPILYALLSSIWKNLSTFPSRISDIGKRPESRSVLFYFELAEIRAFQTYFYSKITGCIFILGNAFKTESVIFLGPPQQFFRFTNSSLKFFVF
jgi:hypothetical protein